jgi:hypothetical protein
MKKALISILFVGGVLSATFASAQTSMSSDEMLRSNERMMDALMQRIQRVNEVSEKQTLIVEHMKMMDIYVSNIEKRIQHEPEAEQKAVLKETYKQGLQRSLVLIESGISDTTIVVMESSVDEHLFFIEQRMTVLQPLMKQLVNANTVLND